MPNFTHIYRHCTCTLSRYEEQKYAEIASEPGIAVKTVETQLGRARVMVRFGGIWFGDAGRGGKYKYSKFEFRRGWLLGIRRERGRSVEKCVSSDNNYCAKLATYTLTVKMKQENAYYEKFGSKK